MSEVLNELNRVVFGLPPELAREVLDFARFLEQQQGQPLVEYGDWTEEELREWSDQAWRQFEAENGPEDWSALLDQQGGSNAATDTPGRHVTGC